MKKTLTPLNDVCIRAAQHMPRARDDMFNQHENDLYARAATARMKIAHVAKRSIS